MFGSGFNLSGILPILSQFLGFDPASKFFSDAMDNLEKEHGGKVRFIVENASEEYPETYTEGNPYPLAGGTATYVAFNALQTLENQTTLLSSTPLSELIYQIVGQYVDSFSEYLKTLSAEKGGEVKVLIGSTDLKNKKRQINLSFVLYRENQKPETLRKMEATEFLGLLLSGEKPV